MQVVGSNHLHKKTKTIPTHCYVVPSLTHFSFKPQQQQWGLCTLKGLVREHSTVGRVKQMHAYKITPLANVWHDGSN